MSNDNNYNIQMRDERVGERGCREFERGWRVIERGWREFERGWRVIERGWREFDLGSDDSESSI